MMDLPPNVNNTVLTNAEKYNLKETEDEFQRRGFFKRLFPSPDFLYYKQFFEEDR